MISPTLAGADDGCLIGASPFDGQAVTRLACHTARCVARARTRCLRPSTL